MYLNLKKKNINHIQLYLVSQQIKALSGKGKNPKGGKPFGGKAGGKGGNNKPKGTFAAE